MADGGFPFVLASVNRAKAVFGRFLPTLNLDGYFEEIVIPSGTPAGVYRLIDCDGYTHARFKVTAGSSFDIRPRWAEDADGTPPTAQIVNLNRPLSNPALNTMNAQGIYASPKAARYLQIYVQSTLANAVTIQVRVCSGLCPMPRAGAIGFQILASALPGTISTTQAQLMGYDLFNTTASTRYVRLSGATAGAYIIPVPANGTARFSLPFWETFGSNMTFAVTTDAAGATPAAPGDVQGRVFYTGS